MTSNREIARQLGISETAVRRAAEPSLTNTIKGSSWC
jgi:hypothetical protein